MRTSRAWTMFGLGLLIVLAGACTTDAESSTGTTAIVSAATSSPIVEAAVTGHIPSDEVLSVLEGRMAAWNQGDGEAAAAFYAADAILEETDNGLVTEGRSGIAARLQELSDAFGMEPAGDPTQFGRLVVEPVNLILEGEPGLYLLVFRFSPDGRQIEYQWVLPTG